MRDNIYRFTFNCLIVTIIFSSCVNQKQIAYFQKIANDRDTLDVAKLYVPKIQPGDILAINIGSLNSAASSLLNPYSTMPATADAAEALANGNQPVLSLNQSSAPNYLVNTDGTIEMPLIGRIKLANLTTAEARDTIKNRAKIYAKEPTVNVRVMNYKISVLGEVAKPSVYVIPNEKITLPEALSLAGDLTIFGKRDNIKIIRDFDGQKQIGVVNLNDRSLFTSKYYYLHNNDVIYVEPGKGRVAQTDRVYQILPVVLSALSLIAIIIETARK